MGAIFPRPLWAFQKNGASERQRKAAVRQEKRHADSMAAAVKFVTGHPLGRFWLRSVLVECGVDDPLPTGDRMVLEEGKRQIGLAILAHVHTHAPEALELMIREHREDAKRVDAMTKAAQEDEKQRQQPAADDLSDYEY